jgi:hypothetical protein
MYGEVKGFPRKGFKTAIIIVPIVCIGWMNPLFMGGFVWMAVIKFIVGNIYCPLHHPT